MNKVLNHDTWQQRYESVDKPLAQFCGQVALEQLEDEYDFVNEQPVGKFTVPGDAVATGSETSAAKVSDI